MRISSLSLASAFALAAFLGGCSGEVGEKSERLGQQASAVQGGTMDTSDQHNFAVGVANRYGGVCSGTLIAPNLVLTARHCVVPPSDDEAVTCSDRFADNVATSALYITTEPNLYKAKAYYGVSEIITPQSKSFCGNDIALIILEKNVPGHEATPATPVVQFKMTDKRLSGSITALGYGITSPTAEDSGQRRVRGNIPLLCIPGSKSMDCEGDMAKFSDDPAEFVTEGHVCSGDSGGGAFDQKSFDAGKPFVMGALSRGPATAEKCLAAIYSRTDAHAPMIIDAGVKAAQQGNYPAPAWTAPEVAGAESDLAASCEGDTCTETDATEPGGATSPKKTVTTSGCSAAPSGASSSSAALLAGLAIAAIAVSRRRRAA